MFGAAAKQIENFLSQNASIAVFFSLFCIILQLFLLLTECVLAISSDFKSKKVERAPIIFKESRARLYLLSDAPDTDLIFISIARGSKCSKQKQKSENNNKKSDHRIGLGLYQGKFGLFFVAYNRSTGR